MNILLIGMIRNPWIGYGVAAILVFAAPFLGSVTVHDLASASVLPVSYGGASALIGITIAGFVAAALAALANSSQRRTAQASAVFPWLSLISAALGVSAFIVTVELRTAVISDLGDLVDVATSWGFWALLISYAAIVGGQLYALVNARNSWSRPPATSWHLAPAPVQRVDNPTVENRPAS